MKDSILLSELFTKKFEELPEWVNSERVIYQIRNLVNNKSYIGQAKWFYGRFVANVWSHYNAFYNEIKYTTYLYKSLRKYGLENFEVFIIESNLIELNSSEAYWISELHTYFKDPLGGGYNLTKGGEDHSYLSEPEIINKSLSTNRSNHNGILAWNTKEAIENRKRSWRLNHEEYLKDPKNVEAEKKAYEYINERLHSKDAIKKQVESNRLNHGGVLSIHTEEANAKRQITMKSIYKEYISDPTNAKADYEARCLARVQVSIRLIEEKINNLRELNLEINAVNYFKPEVNSNWTYERHIKRLLPKLNMLRSSPLWTTEMENIFSHYRLINNKIQII